MGLGSLTIITPLRRMWPVPLGWPSVSVVGFPPLIFRRSESEQVCETPVAGWSD